MNKISGFKGKRRQVEIKPLEYFDLSSHGGGPTWHCQIWHVYELNKGSLGISIWTGGRWSLANKKQ